MGNYLPTCLKPNPNDHKVKIIIWGGVIRTLSKSQPACNLMLEFPDQLVCRANSFYIGQPVPTLSIGDSLVEGETYLVIPIDRLPCQVLSAASIASLSTGPNRKPINFGDNPFEFVKNSNGDSSIKVSSDFLTKILIGHTKKPIFQSDGGGEFTLCSTPELRKHYDQLVGPKLASWSPKLDTISERRKSRLSPIRSPITLSPIRLLGR